VEKDLAHDRITCEEKPSISQKSRLLAPQRVFQRSLKGRGIERLISLFTRNKEGFPIENAVASEVI